MDRHTATTSGTCTTFLLPRLLCPKKLLSNIDVPPNALLFTADAKSMYTNIRSAFQHYDVQALIEALEIVFQNNILQLEDTYWRQISGTGMGIAQAPPWATIYYTIHKNRVLPKWRSNVLFYCQFIDNVIGL
eukprot:CCRYP_010664-RA/>CCRYP_010664-RA protein AED:0.41 eAED:0.41 QI:0/0/0/1/0/0/2/0/131